MSMYNANIRDRLTCIGHIGSSYMSSCERHNPSHAPVCLTLLSLGLPLSYGYLKLEDLNRIQYTCPSLPKERSVRPSPVPRLSDPVLSSLQYSRASGLKLKYIGTYLLIDAFAHALSAKLSRRRKRGFRRGLQQSQVRDYVVSGGSFIYRLAKAGEPHMRNGQEMSLKQTIPCTGSYARMGVQCWDI